MGMCDLRRQPGLVGRLFRIWGEEGADGSNPHGSTIAIGTASKDPGGFGAPVCTPGIEGKQLYGTAAVAAPIPDAPPVKATRMDPSVSCLCVSTGIDNRIAGIRQPEKRYRFDAVNLVW